MVKTSVLAKEMIADTLPLDSAVKNPEERILNPQNRKFMANSPEAGDSQLIGFRIIREDGDNAGGKEDGCRQS